MSDMVVMVVFCMVISYAYKLSLQRNSKTNSCAKLTLTYRGPESIFLYQDYTLDRNSSMNIEEHTWYENIHAANNKLSLLYIFLLFNTELPSFSILLVLHVLVFILPFSHHHLERRILIHTHITIAHEK